MKLKLIFIIAILTNWLLATTLYENGDNASDWVVIDNRPSGATVSSVIDSYGGNVIEFNGHGVRNAYLLGDKRASVKAWNNSEDKNIKWSMKFDKSFRISIYVKTSMGSRVIYYDNKSGKGKRRTKIHYGLGSDSNNGEWQTITRDLEADIKAFESNNKLEMVYGFEVRGSGRIDNIFMSGDDNQAPTIKLLNLTEGDIIQDVTTVIKVKITDDNVGVDYDSIEFYINDINQTNNITRDGDVVTYIPTAKQPLPFGTVKITVKAKDNAKNQALKDMNIFVQEKNKLTATPIASSISSYAPTTITFSPKVTTNNAIQTYSWDFNGDGSYDRSDITANSYSWSYTTPGDYNVTLKVVDANGDEVTGSVMVHILNSPPQVTVESTPSNGAVPLTVQFVATATDFNGIARYEWDFDGDGTYDKNSTDGNVSYQYTTQGVFNAKVRVIDNLGASTVYTTPTTKVLALTSGSPSVVASSSTTQGKAPLNVAFNATATDPQNKGFSKYEWDFDGDGVYDYSSSSSASVSHNFVNAGTFYPKIKVTTTDGRVTYDALEIVVEQSLSLSVSSDTIDTENNDTTTIHTILGAKAEISLVIEDENKNVVKIIQDWSTRESGSYDDIWNGTNNANQIVKEGKYYAVLLYKESGEIKRLDLRETTGGSRYNPSRNNAPRSFAPLDNRPLKMTFTLPRASEVVSFMGYSYSNTRIITFRSREPLGRGTYTDIWNGQNDEGVLISPPPGKWFMYGVWAFTLADNAIYVKSGVYVSNLIATPPIYTPDSHESEGKQATLKIDFELNKASNVEMELYDAIRGVIVASRNYSNLDAGEQRVEYDGKDNSGNYLYPGTYTLGVRAVDENGYRSIMHYTIIRIKY